MNIFIKPNLKQVLGSQQNPQSLSPELDQRSPCTMFHSRADVLRMFVFSMWENEIL